MLRRNPERATTLDGRDVADAVGQLDDAIAIVEAEGVVVRGLYDVQA